MATSSEWHESYEAMSEETLNFSRALKSLQEELEAVDWYNQRVEATKDDQLRRILAHNRDEEKEHFVMLLEWLRRRDAKFATELHNRLETSGSIVAEEQASKGEATASSDDGSLGIGSLKGGNTL